MRKQILGMILTLSSMTVLAQNLNVTGVVVSEEDGEPLVGVSVQVKENPSNGVATDFDGKYSINVNKGQTLRFSYVGCEAQERRIETSGVVDVKLSSESNVLDEVVAIGYGTVKKSDLTGSVSSITADKLQKTPAANLANALQGQAAGVTVNSLSGRPGAAPEVRIRGVGTVNGASPIYVVDGVITDDITFLSPNDIERTEILKDASATAIYGSRGANGVIIVTTKTGKTKDARITFDAYVGWQMRYKKLDVMKSKQFADTYVAINGNNSMKKFYAENDFNTWLSTYMGVGNSDYYPTVYNAETNPTGFDYSKQETDWQDEVFRTGMIQNYHLSVDGSSDRFT
ncbi:MAG: TonB-dependent receptor plug domain-containing protein, partial [Muribaculaceae bacterium]|nr:TonB-dependent receptor plug domain-containing protein [Muribaculaceae bacterium]